MSVKKKEKPNAHFAFENEYECVVLILMYNIIFPLL